MMRSLIALVLSIAVLFVAQSSAMAQSPRGGQLMSSANGFYDRGEFEDAARIYQQLVSLGTHNSRLYYNLGNAYFMQGDVGRAMLNYLRAQRLTPRDFDVRTNLAIARDEVEVPPSQSGPSPVSRLSAITNPYVTATELGFAALGVWLLTGMLLVAFLLIPRGLPRKLVGVFVVVVAVVFVAGTTLLGARLLTESQETAVVVAFVSEVVDGPGQNFTTRFTLNSGSELRVLETRGSWVNFQLPESGQEGWLAAEDVEMLSVP